MSTINDGGPAFPVQDASKWQAHGMTLRDYFAAKALGGMLGGEPGGHLGFESAASEAYSYADAMLKARQA